MTFERVLHDLEESRFKFNQRHWPFVLSALRRMIK